DQVERSRVRRAVRPQPAAPNFQRRSFRQAHAKGAFSGETEGQQNRVAELPGLEVRNRDRNRRRRRHWFAWRAAARHEKKYENKKTKVGDPEIVPPICADRKSDV